MSDNTKQSDVDPIFGEDQEEDKDTSEDHADSAGGSDPQADQGKENELSTAEVERQKQIAKWQERIDDGMPITGLPENLSWMKQYLKLPGDSIDDRVDSVIERKNQDKRFKKLEAAIKEQKLTKEQKSTINKEYIDLMRSGVPKDRALKIAAKMADVDVSATLQSSSSRQLPPQGVSAVQDSI